MNVSSTINLTGVKFNTNQALENKNSNIKEGEKVASEITFIPWEDINYEKAIGKDGKEFEVVSYYRIKGEELNKDYLDVFSSEAQGKEDKCYDYYVKNFIAEVTKNFSDSGSLKNDEESLKKGIDNIVSEMKNNNSKGVSNKIENLNTKFNVNGVDFTFKELMDSSNVMDYANSMLPIIKSGLDYVDYAKMGIVKGKVSTYAEKNLNRDQQKLIDSTISTRIEKIIDAALEGVDELYKKGIATDKNNKFYAIKNAECATNREYAEEIMYNFAKVDYSNRESFQKATEKYKDLIKPVLESEGVINMGRNEALTDTINYQIGKFQSLFNESYESIISSVSEVKKRFGKSKFVVDVCR